MESEYLTYIPGLSPLYLKKQNKFRNHQIKLIMFIIQ